MRIGKIRLSHGCGRRALTGLMAGILYSVAVTTSAGAQTTIGPPSSPMTIPLPEPIFWDPAGAEGDYAIVEQQSGIYLLRPSTGRIIAKLHPLQGSGAQSLGGDPFAGGEKHRETLPTPFGWPFRPGDEIPSAPSVADFDDDGAPEAVFATRAGWVWMLSRDGLPLGGWPVALNAECMGGVSLADLDGDGVPEILAGDHEGRVHALRRDGSPLPGWPASLPGFPEMPAICAPVACADLDGNGSVEVVACQAEGRVCVFRSDGHPAVGWPVDLLGASDPPNAGTIFSRPALGDMNGDGRMEIVAGANNYRVHVWDLEGRSLPGWPRLLGNYGRAGYADPVIADLDLDGRPEIVIPTDQGFHGPPRVYVLDAMGQDKKGWPADLPERCNAAVAVGDLDHDGHPEVVAATVGEDAWLLAWNYRGRAIRGFPVGLREMSVNAGPVLADADGDGDVDILLAALRTRFDPATLVLALNGDGRLLPDFPVYLEGCEVVGGGPCIADLDGDGKLELLLGTQVQGRLWVWNLEGAGSERCAPWPRPGFDNANSGHYRPPGSAAGSVGSGVGPEEPGPQPGPGAFDPSPFPALSSVSFLLNAGGHVRLIVKNVQGRVLRTLLDAELPTGSYTISWDGTDGQDRRFGPGVYFYELTTPQRRANGQLLLLR